MRRRTTASSNARYDHATHCAGSCIATEKRSSLSRHALRSALCALLVSLPSVAWATPYFSDVTSASFPTQPCGTGAEQGCYTNFLVVADIDGDGHLDIAFANGGGYYTAGDAQPTVVYRNKGDGTFEDVSSWLGSDTRRLRQVALADIDGDGDLDVYLPDGYGLNGDKVFVQTAAGQFADQSTSLLPAGLASHAGAAHFGDLDGDGDLDLVVTDWGTAPSNFGADGDTVHLYLNDGSGKLTEGAASAIPAPIPGADGNTPIDIDVADVDGDFDLDVIVNDRNGQSRLWLNDGHASFTDVSSSNHPPKNGPYTYNVELCDIDGDGDLDMLLDNAGANYPNGHSSQVLVNDGQGKFTDETEARISNEPSSDDNAVKCLDIDDDGDFDLIVASLSNPSEKLLINDGTGHFTFEDGGFPDADDPTLGIDVGDLDGDGILDVVTGQGESTPRLNRVYRGVTPAKADTRAPVFRAVQTPTATANTPIVMRVGVSDAHTSETGQHVSKVEVTYEINGASQKVPAKFVGGDLFQATIPPQAADTSITITASATDRAAHTATSSPITVTVSGSGGTGGASGAGGTAGSGGSAGSGGTGATGGSAGIGGTAGTAGTTAGSSASASEEDDGCGCRQAGATPMRSSGSVVLLAAALSAFVRRRKSRESQA
ncbi:MAG: FG-GAP-like repeat-containing protein [Polyangiaceae bacterium]